jgi:hypothetical protein
MPMDVSLLIQTIVLDASPVIASVVCNAVSESTGTYTITVTATGFSAALQYSADGSNQTGNVITVNAPGTYTISVKDAMDVVLLRTSYHCRPVFYNSYYFTFLFKWDGVIAVATTGGSGNYEYRIDSGVYPMATLYRNCVRNTYHLCA